MGLASRDCGELLTLCYKLNIVRRSVLKFPVLGYEVGKMSQPLGAVPVLGVFGRVP